MNHPERGILLPETFIPMAEETDLIMSLDWRIITQATRQFSIWLKQFPETRPLIVSVNVSSKHFAFPDFAQHLGRVIAEAQILPKHIKLEVREGALMDNLASVSQVLGDLETMGVRLLLDDFGTRYSSLSNLHRLPMEMLKIDRTFVTNMLEVPENMAIVRTIRALAKTLDLSVVAEGIETEALYQKVGELGCEYLQGNYISKPLTVAETTALLEKGGPLIPPN